MTHAILRLLAVSLLPVAGTAQAPAASRAAFDFTIPNIMRGPELYGTLPARATRSGTSAAP